MKFHKTIIPIVILFSTFLFIFPKVIFAQESVKSFSSDITARKDGDMQINETIEYDFGSSERHGIYRNIPLISKIGDLYRVIGIKFNSVKRDGKEEKYEITYDSKSANVKIGDPGKTISGTHNYLISYFVSNGIGSNYEDHDEIYWNVTGNDWGIPIEFAQAIIKTDFGAISIKAKCFTGKKDSKLENCSIPQNPPFNPASTESTLNPNEGLTVVYGFPLNTFAKSTLQKTPPASGFDFANFLKIYSAVALFLNFVLAPAWLLAYFKNKRKSRFGPISVNFDLPEDQTGKRIAPALAGTIDSAKLEKDDVRATIFDLAIRKYLRIEQVDKKGKFLGLGSSSDYKLINLEKDEMDLEEFEKKLMDDIFEGGNEIFLKDVSSFYLTFESVEKKVFDVLVNRGFYTKNPATQRGLLIFGGIASLFTLNIVLSFVLLWFARVLNGRTALGDEIDWKIDGLKLFLKQMSRNYKWQAQQLYIVEKMIPFAIALGYIDKYMDQLKIIKPDYHPSWYNGPTSFYYASPAMFNSLNSNITTSAPSSSSGFSGGGSSGGGGSGGGGGSW